MTQTNAPGGIDLEVLACSLERWKRAPDCMIGDDWNIIEEAARLFLEQQKASDQTEELKDILNNPIVNRDGTLSFAPSEVELIKRTLFARARKKK